MSTVSIEPLLHHSVRENVRCGPKYKAFKRCSLNCSPNHKLNFSARSFCNFRPPKAYALRTSAATDTTLVETVESTDVFFRETFPLKRTETLTVGCNVLGKWILHWGVSYVDDVGRYGNIDELKEIVKIFHEVNMKTLGDVVLNHRCAEYKNQNGIWNIFGGRLSWDDHAVVGDDPHFQGRGNKSSGDNFHAAPNIDHSQDFVRKDLIEWLRWLREEIGYDGWRLDFVRGFWGGYVKEYLEASEPFFAVGEYWDSLSYTYGEMDHNQDAHRQRIIDWISATSGTAGAFDVTTKGILHSHPGPQLSSYAANDLLGWRIAFTYRPHVFMQTLERCEYWRLSDQKGKPPGVVGWWPSRAVTFIENHDTGSTQGHWRFPGGKEMQGYAYILTHPGTPSVFYDHIFSHYQSEIAALISLRNRNKIHCRSTVQITKAERDVYAAIIGEKVAMKIGPGHYEPPSGQQRWSLAAEGKDYKAWEAS
ncbi:Alpha-amylase 3, chloroplastic [Morella rubra]|uniref:alpha-amylase n=1 Tax=Morella rubra TaxID=262757 RepID=A0A6A1V6A7_9ROSI|nr:Alpha-amylase 3, chloroplastic [Morella rubra]